MPEPQPLPAPPGAPALPDHCLNCEATLPRPRPHYCPDCGQETNLRPPTLAEFAQQFGGSVLATEGALWRSLTLLLRRPGALTLEYLRGRRRRYVLPLRLYLTLSLVSLLAIRLSASAAIELDGAPALEAKPANVVVLDFGRHRVGLDQGRFFCEELPRWLCRRLERRLDLAPKAVQRELEELPGRFIGHWGSAMFALVPLFAVITRAMYWRRGLRYTEHLVFALHLHAFWFLAMALMVLPFGPVKLAALLAMPAYAFMAARRVFGGTRWATALRGAAIGAAYGALVMAALAAVLAWALIA